MKCPDGVCAAIHESDQCCWDCKYQDDCLKEIRCEGECSDRVYRIPDGCNDDDYCEYDDNIDPGYDGILGKG